LASVSTGNEGVEGRCNGPVTFRGVCGSREALRRFCVDARPEREFGKAGRADVGGWDALKDARGGRGNVVVVVVAIGGYSPAKENVSKPAPRGCQWTLVVAKFSKKREWMPSYLLLYPTSPYSRSKICGSTGIDPIVNERKTNGQTNQREKETLS